MSGLGWRNLTVCHGREPAVHHLDADIPRGAMAALIGRNGAGKSTLLRATLGWMTPTTGRVELDGVPIGQRQDLMQYLPQRSAIDWDFPVTVADVVAMGRFPRLGSHRAFGAADHAAVNEAILAMGLDRLTTRPLAALSGGQQQRVLIARALASGAEVLLLDEPFAGLDPLAATDLAGRLRRWAADHRLVIAAMHEIDLARTHCTHALAMNTHLVACGPAAEVLTDPILDQTFSRPLAHRAH